MTKTFRNIVCWNTKARPEVMKTVALRVRESIFHATHFPSPISKLNPNTGAKVRYSEQDLLRDFMDDRKDHVFCSAVGDPGTGKSHLIGWLHSQLSLDSDLDKELYFVLVPRHSGNLAAVLECILTGFDSPAVQQIKKEIQWTHNINHQGACTKIIAELAFVLDPNNFETIQLSFPDDEEHQIILNLISAFLDDRAIRDCLTENKEGIIGRLAEHLSGKREKRLSDEETLNWEAEDLKFNPAVIAKAGDDAGELAGALLQDVELRKIAAQILNKAQKVALPNLAGVRQGSLRNALAEIRRSLKKEEKQLVLFIEDLSVAHGVDAELVEALLVTPSDGGDDLCILRSIVGLTNDDFDRLQENLKGRIDIAVSLDLEINDVGENNDDKFAIEELIDFASRYLNAARYDLQSLDKWLAKRRGTEECKSYCLTKKCPHINPCHEAFGEINGIGFYPLSPFAIERLYKQQLKINNAKPLFNPRLLVSRVLNDFMNEAEHTIPEKNFPGIYYIEWYGLSSVGVAIQTALNNELGEELGRRFRTSIEIYSEEPIAGKLKPNIAEAFSLPSISGPIEPPDTTPTPKPQPKPEIDVYDKWLNKKEISAAEVNLWRKVIYAAICGVHDWDADPYASAFYSSFSQQSIEIESQTTQTKGDVVLKIKRKPEIATAIKGLVNEFKFSEKTESRMALIYSLEYLNIWVADIRNQFKKMVNAPGSQKPLKLALQALSLGVHLNPKSPKITNPQELLRALLSPWYERKEADLTQTQGTPAWRYLYKAFDSLGEDVRVWLCDQIVCRKGGSRQRMLIDCSLVFDDLQTMQKNLHPLPLPPQAEKWNKRIYRKVMELNERINKHFKNAIDTETKSCEKYLNELEGYLEKQNSSKVVEILLKAFEVGISEDILPKGAIDLQSKLSMLSDGRLDEQIKLMRSATGTAGINKRIRSLSLLDRNIVEAAVYVLSDCGGILQKGIESIDKKITNKGLENPDDLHKKVAKLLVELSESLNVIKGGE